MHLEIALKVTPKATMVPLLEFDQFGAPVFRRKRKLDSIEPATRVSNISVSNTQSILVTWWNFTVCSKHKQNPLANELRLAFNRGIIESNQREPLSPLNDITIIFQS